MAGMRLALNTNMDEVFSRLDAFVEGITAVAVPRALNKLNDQAFTVGLREVARKYGIGPRTFEKFMSQRYAPVPGGVESILNAKGAGLPLILFNPIPSQPTRGGQQKGKGVSVRIKGKRIFIPHAFIQRMPGSGHVGVFARGAYGARMSRHVFISTGEVSGRFAFSKGRLSINELYTFSPPTAMNSRDVVEVMENRLREQAPKVLAQEIRFAAR